ncbi:ATP-dependent zinc protease family protein [Methyloligella solikamskensis]|uniref:ATP-dependent zinc protease n=1 Tax=Methyloligella solikamskensis TaxID=1177756 RepID=A0ABW3JBV5_9HYPH
MTKPIQPPASPEQPTRRRRKRGAPTPALHIGWREWVGLPELGVPMVKAKIDTGARTSAIHAWKMEPFQRDGQIWLRFELHPEQRSKQGAVTCEAPVVDRRQVKSSGGHVTNRYVIRTTLTLGTGSWPIELTLTNRDQMGFRMLLGRTALKHGVLIDPARSFLASADLVPPRRRPRSKPPSD